MRQPQQIAKVFRTATLEKVSYAFSHTIPRRVLERNVNVSARLDRAAGALVAELKLFLWASEPYRQEVGYTEVPATWHDALKLAIQQSRAYRWLRRALTYLAADSHRKQLILKDDFVRLGHTLDRLLEAKLRKIPTVASVTHVCPHMAVDGDRRIIYTQEQDHLNFLTGNPDRPDRNVKIERFKSNVRALAYAWRHLKDSPDHYLATRSLSPYPYDLRIFGDTLERIVEQIDTGRF
jgi:hypothetical protein